MLRGIRKASSNWLGKVIMGAVVAFLVISFAIWGIGDIFRGFGLSNVASIGNIEISIEQFRQTYLDKLQQIGRQIGKPISSDEARERGLDKQILGQMIAEAALDERTRQLGLGITDKAVAVQITKDAAFRGPTGQFDRSQFEQIIRQAGYTEGRFVQEQRQLILRRQLADTVTGDLIVPQALVEAFHHYQTEQRSIDYVVLGAAQAGTIPAPTPEQLSKYFEDHKVEFRAPEYRTTVLIPLSPQEIGMWTPVSDADAKKFYQDHRANYVTPEKRRVRQIVFPNEAEAKAAREKIANGATFESIAKERKLSDQDVDLGLVPKSSIIDPAVADAVFALKVNEVSQPVKGRFGTALVQVTAIEAEKVQPFEEVAPQIRGQIATDRGKNKLFDLRDKIEDERAAGATLKEIADKLKLPSRTVDVDRAGRSPDGSQVQLPAAGQLIPGIFSSGVDVDVDPIQYDKDSLVYYNVTKITPSRERPLKEVKAQVETRWHNDQVADKLKAKADAMIAKLKAGGNLQELATANDLKLESAKDLTRTQPTEAVPPSVLQTVFQTGKGAAATTEAPALQRYVLRVTGISVPPLDAKSPQAKQLTEGVRRSMADAMLGEYLAQLENDIGVSVNQSAVNQAIGGGQQ